MESRMSFKKLILIIMIFVIALSAVFVYTLPFWDIACVKGTAWVNGKLYGTDEQNGKIRIFSCDANGNNAWIDTVYSSDKTNETYYGVKQFEVSENGLCTILLKAQDIAETKRFISIEYDLNNKKILNTKTIDIEQNNDIYIEKNINGIIWYVSNDGSVWQKNDAENDALVFFNNGTVIPQENTAYTFGNDGLYFYNTQSNEFYVIPYDTGIVNIADNIHFNDEISSLGKIYSLNQMKDGTWTATFYNQDGKLIPMVVGISDKPFDRLSYSFYEVIAIIVSVAIIAFAIIFVVLLLIKRFRKTFPTELKIIFISIPVLVLCCFMMEISIEKILKYDVQKRVLSQMYYTASTIENNKDFKSALNKGQPVNIYENINGSMDYDVIYDNNGILAGRFNGIIGKVSVFGYDDSNIYSLDTENILCYPEYLASADIEKEYINNAVEFKTPVSCVLNTYSMGRCLALYYPTVQNDNVTSVIRILYQEKNLNYDIKEQQKELIYNVFILLSGIIIFLAITSFILLRPLKKIRNALYDFAVGIDIEEPDDSNGSEIKEMNNLFYNMIVNVKEHLYNVDQLKKAYEPYIPQKLISLFGKDDIREITPQDETIIEDAVILVIDAIGFSKAVSKAGVQEMFYFVNSALERLTEIAENEGGVVVQFTDTGVFVYFKNEPENALSSAVNAQKSLLSLPETLSGQNVVFGAGMIYGNINLGIIGGEERMEIRAVSPEMSFARYLQKISAIYKLGVLIDETVEEKIEGITKRDNVRCIGRIGFSGNINSERTIYEAFGGQKEEIVLLKQITKKDFECGIDYYQEGKYEEAKACFLSVFSKNRDDMAVRRYLKLCSVKLAGKEKGRNTFEQY